MVAHLTVYAALYAIFVAATLDAAAKSGSRLGIIRTVDLGLSIAPMAAAASAAWKALCPRPPCTD